MDVHHFNVPCQPDVIVPEVSDDLVSEGDSETDGKEPVHVQNDVDLIRVPQMLWEDLASLKWAIWEENVNQILVEQEMEEAKANMVDPDVVLYIEAPALHFKNASTWEGIAVANP